MFSYKRVYSLWMYNYNLVFALLTLRFMDAMPHGEICFLWLPVEEHIPYASTKDLPVNSLIIL